MPDTVRDLILQAAAKYKIDPTLPLAVAEQESGFNPTLINPKSGAIGTFQFLPSTAQSRGINANDYRVNIDEGVKYLRELMDTHQGDLDQVLAEYGGVKTDTTYVPAVRKRILRFQRELATADTAMAPATSTTSPPPTSTPPPAFATTGMTSPSTTAAQSTLASMATGAKRFGSEALRAGVVEPLQGLAGLATTAVDQGPIAAGKQLISGLVAPTIEHSKAAIQAAKEGRILGTPSELGAISHALRAVPIAGPIGEQIGEQLQSGDVAGGLGRAAGIGATFAAPKALRNVAQNKLGEAAVPLLRSERTGSSAAQFLEHIAERTLPGRNVFRTFRQRQQTALQAEGERLASEISTAPLTGPEAAHIITDAIDKSMEARKAEASFLYEQIDRHTESTTRRVPVTRDVPSRIVGPSGEALTVPERTLQKVEVGGVQPETRVLKLVAIPLLRRIRAESALLPPQELARTTELLSRIAGAPKRVSFSAFQDARSDLLRIVRSHGDPIPGKAGGAAKLLAGSADNAMMTAAEQSGIAELPDLVREANALWRDSKEIYNAPFIKRIIESSPERIPQLIRAGTMEDLTLLKQAVPAPVFKMASARVLRDVLEDATTPPPTPTSRTLAEGLGLTEHGVPVTEAPQALSGPKISDALRRMGYEKSVQLWGKATVDGLDDIAQLAERIRPENVNRVAGGLIAAGINASILAPVLRPFGINFGSLGYSVSATVGINLLARLLTKPEGIQSLRRFVRVLGTGQRPAAIAAASQLSRQVEQAQQDLDDLLKQPTAITATGEQRTTAPAQPSAP